MIGFDIDNKLITETEFNEFEDLIEVDLPKDYKDHMLKYNGGSSPMDKEILINGDDTITFSYFHPIKYGHNIMEKFFELKQDFLYPRYLSIGATVEGALVMLVEEEKKELFIHILRLNCLAKWQILFLIC